MIEAYPGQEGKWFATAKDLGFFELALELARKGPCDPRTLSRAARVYHETNPAFAVEVGMAALYWIFEGYGYELTSADVWDAYEPTLKAARALGKEEEIRSKICEAVKSGLTKRNWVAGILAREFQSTR